MNVSLPKESSVPLMGSQGNDAFEAQTGAVASSSLSSFDDFFLEHWTMVYHWLLRMTGDPDEAQDIALETFYRFYLHPPKPGEGSNLKGWLYRVSTRLGLHAIRSQKRRRFYEQAAAREALGDPHMDQPPEILDGRQASETARLALGRLPPRQAELLSLRYSGMTYRDIAQTLGLAPTSIGPLLLRAEREFAKIYRSLSREEP